MPLFCFLHLETTVFISNTHLQRHPNVYIQYENHMLSFVTFVTLLLLVLCYFCCLRSPLLLLGSLVVHLITFSLLFISIFKNYLCEGMEVTLM